MYLIGGAPRVGKSLVAKRIAKHLDSDLISTDDLCDVYMETLSVADQKRLFPFPMFDGDPSKNVFSPEELVDFQYRSANSLKETIRHEIDRLSGTEAVIEGVHLLPEIFREWHLDASLFHVLFVGCIDADLVVDGIMKNTNPQNWLKDSDPVVIRQVAEFSAEFSRRIKREAEECGFAYFERTEYFEEDLDRMGDLLS